MGELDVFIGVLGARWRGHGTKLQEWSAEYDGRVPGEGRLC